ncbi:SusC/RagA family TonB-linked outer membrane protein [Chitinophaga alhagiae]|uniref:SusC/RagA family TonB-linked outer membrane protein n=2 Tax=Chitinophaga alhagiae TaxID=2203219 RepID=A0ABM6WDW8_9BACT|nr:SusC/RagA family TonB-linked outer membrane protein [Chitinophaga alhagiae]
MRALRCCALLVLFLTSFSAAVMGQRTITGTVVDESQQGLPGVNVFVRNKSSKTVTAGDGRYSIQAATGDSIVYSFVGMKVMVVPVRDRSSIDVTLERTTTSLQDVVVIGYGTVRKGDLTGSVGVVNMEDAGKAPVSNFAEALAGRIAGVQASSADGQPGASINLVVRGANSINYSNSPLYVIDGFPFEDPQPASLNPADIASITVLKDASSTAVYGSRAANGVVVIETKKGKLGRPVVTFNSSAGWQSLQKKVDLMNAYEFVKYQEELNIVRATPDWTAARYYSNGRTLESYKTIETIDWQDLIIRNAAPFMNYDIALRGGAGGTRYSISGNIHDQEGVLINTGFKRYQGRLTLDQTISKTFSAGLNANYGYTDTYGPPAASGQFTNYTLYQTWGYRPVAGEGIDLLNDVVDPDNNVVNNYRFNPYLSRTNDHTQQTSGNLNAALYVSVNLTPSLVARVSGSIYKRTDQRDLFYNSNTPQGSPKIPENTRGINGSVFFNQFNIWSNENTLTYRKRFNDHAIDAVGGFSNQYTKNQQFGYSGMNLPNESFGMSGLEEGQVYASVASVSSNSLSSVFGRVNYGYKSRYLLTVTFRADGSSKFKGENQWGYFPSGAFAWNVIEEPFMKSQRLFSNLKFRTSHGITGNNRVGDFAYAARITMPLVNSYSWNNASPTHGLIQSALENKDLRWETTEQTDIGLDAGFLKNRVELTVDVYRKTTRDLLLSADIPGASGLTTSTMNIGSTQNRGLEITLNTVNIEKRDFTWSSNFNISFNRNKIIALADGQQSLTGSSLIASNLYMSFVGQEAGTMWGYVFDGVYQYEDFDSPSPGKYILKKQLPSNGNARNTIQPGDQKLKDLNGDGTVDIYDMTVIGRSQPVHTGGFTNNFRYRNFDLNVFMQWSYGNDLLNMTRYQYEGNGSRLADLNQFASYIDRWSPTNPSNTLYRAGGQGPLARSTSRLVEDGSYLRLKTVSLGYNMPKHVARRLYMSDLRLHCSAQNLLTISGYSGLDPEVSRVNSILSGGLDFCAYPHARTITFGLNATF